MTDNNRPVSSSIFKAASEPDLSILPNPPRSPPPRPPALILPIPSSSTHDLSADDPMLSQAFLNPGPSPSSSPPHSPHVQIPRGSPRNHSPSPSPTFQNPPNSAVSFTEYVASEFATEPPFSLAIPDPPSPTLPRPRRYRLQSDGSPPPSRIPPRDFTPPPRPRPSVSTAGLNTHVAAGMHSDDSLPHLPGEDPTPMPTGKPTSSEPSVPLHPRARWSKLDCIQLDDRGEHTQRTLTRAEILQEARATLTTDAQTSGSLARFFDDSQPGHAEHDNVHSRRAAHRALRDYLRNSLQPRDIRQVDPAFVAKPALWVRHSALVVSLEGLRAIILYNKMFLFDPTRQETQHLVFVAKRSILADPDAENPQPFEFKALESILIFLSMGLDREFSELKPKIDNYLHQLPNELTTKMLEELRRKKQQLNHFHARAGNVKTILENLLEEDEEMANMYLTEKHMTHNYMRSSEDHSEIETLLEAYLQVIDEHVNHASLLNDAIDDTEDLVMIHLDTLRNRLLSVELALSVVSMMFSFGGVISGIFGMNITIPLFQPTTSRLWFLAVVIVIFSLVISVSWMVLLSLRRRGLYSLY